MKYILPTALLAHSNQHNLDFGSRILDSFLIHWYVSA